MIRDDIEWSRWEPLLGTMRDVDLGKRIGCSETCVRRHRVALGILSICERKGGVGIRKQGTDRDRLYLSHRPSQVEMLKYGKQWEIFQKVNGGKCQNYKKRGCDKNQKKRRTPHGIYCHRHWMIHPRCTVKGCDNMAVIDPVVNPDMLCREHLFDYENDKPTVSPWRTRSMLADAPMWLP
jgi:hypothetical protein